MSENLVQITDTEGHSDNRKVYVITPKPDNGFFDNELNLPEGSNLIPNVSSLVFASQLKKDGADVEFSDYFNKQDDLINEIEKTTTKEVNLFLGFANQNNGLKLKKQLESRGIKVVLNGIYNFIDGQNFSDCSVLKELGIESEEPILDANIKIDYKLNKSIQDLFDAQKQFGKPKSLAVISQYGGCPKNKNCLHCSSFRIECADGTTKSMIKPPKETMEEVVELKDEFNLDTVVITDLMISGQRLKELSEAGRDLALPNLRISTAPNHINEETIKYLKEINCKEVFLGVESYNEELIKSLHKSFSLKDVDRAMNLLYESGIKANVSLMLGIEGENKETIEETMKFIKFWQEKKFETEPFLKLQTSIMTPIPGSHLYQILKEKNGEKETLELLKGENWIGALQKRYAELFSNEEISKEINSSFKELREMSESSYIEQVEKEINPINNEIKMI